MSSYVHGKPVLQSGQSHFPVHHEAAFEASACQQTEPRRGDGTAGRISRGGDAAGKPTDSPGAWAVAATRHGSTEDEGGKSGRAGRNARPAGETYPQEAVDELCISRWTTTATCG